MPTSTHLYDRKAFGRLVSLRYFEHAALHEPSNTYVPTCNLNIEPVAVVVYPIIRAIAIGVE